MSMRSNHIIILVLLAVALLSPIIVVSQINPSNHWLTLITHEEKQVNVTAMAYYNGILYVILRDSDNGDNAFTLVAIDPNSGKPVDLSSGNSIYNMTYILPGVGTIRTCAVDTSNAILYLGSSNGHIIVISLIDYTVKTAYKLSITGTTINDIKYLGLDSSGFMSIAVRGDTYAYTLIVNVNTDPWKILAGVTIDSGADIYWALNSYTNYIALFYVYYLDTSTGNPVYASLKADYSNPFNPSITVNFIDEISGNGDAFVNSYNYKVVYDPTNNSVILPAVMQGSPERYTLLYKLDTTSGSMYYGKNISIDGTSVEGISVLLPGDGNVHVFGTITTGKSYGDALYTVFNPDNNAINMWKIGGYGIESMDNGYAALSADGFDFAGVNTLSFGDSGSYSAMVFLTSPGLKNGEYYYWPPDKPTYSNPSDGALVTTVTPTIKNVSTIEPGSGKYKIAIADLAAESVDSTTGKLFWYIGVTASVPVPVPEGLLFIIIGVVLGFAIIYTKILRKRTA